MKTKMVEMNLAQFTAHAKAEVAKANSEHDAGEKELAVKRVQLLLKNEKAVAAHIADVAKGLGIKEDHGPFSKSYDTAFGAGTQWKVEVFEDPGKDTQNESSTEKPLVGGSQTAGLQTGGLWKSVEQTIAEANAALEGEATTDETPATEPEQKDGTVWPADMSEKEFVEEGKVVKRAERKDAGWGLDPWAKSADAKS